MQVVTATASIDIERLADGVEPCVLLHSIVLGQEMLHRIAAAHDLGLLRIGNSFTVRPNDSETIAKAPRPPARQRSAHQD